MSNLQELIEIVRASRERTNGVFPLPDGDSCIDYAITEAGEYLDAVLRERRNGDKRNNDKQHNPRKEWGQCGYMIASAIIQTRIPDDYTVTEWLDRISIYTFVANLCDIQDGRQTGKDTNMVALDMWSHLAIKWGWDAAELMAETCDAFECKHIPAEVTP